MGDKKYAGTGLKGSPQIIVIFSHISNDRTKCNKNWKGENVATYCVILEFSILL